MTPNRLIIAAIAAACALLCGPAPRVIAHEAHSHGASANIPIPETAEGIVDEISKKHAAITAAVTGKNLKAVHDLSEAMTALAKALPEKVEGEKKAPVQSSTKNMINLLDTLHHAADDGNQPRAGIELKKLDAVVTALEKQLK